MDTKHLLRIVGYKIIPYRNKKTGAPEEIRLAQTIVTSDSVEKGQQVLVGELMMPKLLWDTRPNFSALGKVLNRKYGKATAG
ncbi:hypothetical protein [Herbaspirillum sp. RV1423]|uniref:hypothetical protein n=1 Tax=Herbaspirillum sp. RV1423 TaxID=1443993 RepID=UPI0012DF5E41|nr:hypothetical protein [Herbaspirillum sp. RV1423]